MHKIPIIAPSILSADFTKMGEEIKRIGSADWIHCDVMDGRFVPNITFGFKMIADIKKVTQLPLDIHLMIVEPEKYIGRFIDSGADWLTFHVEAADKPLTCLEQAKKAGIKAGLAISPDTPICKLEPFLSMCDIIVLMSVYPGFGGQKFIQNSLNRLIELKTLRNHLNPSALIEIDGGITLDNAAEAVNCGADVLVAGNTVFGAKHPDEAVKLLQNLNGIKG